MRFIARNLVFYKDRIAPSPFSLPATIDAVMLRS